MVYFYLANMRTITSQLVLSILELLIAHSNALAVIATDDSSSSYSPESPTAVSIAVPPSHYSSDIIDANFPAFAFEQASFVNYVLDGDGNTNVFSQNLIDAVTSRTGGTPYVGDSPREFFLNSPINAKALFGTHTQPCRIIRLGGTSADYGTYMVNQTTPALPLATDNTNYDVGNTTIGPSFWALTSRFPGAEYMIQVPLATTDVNETILWTQTAVENINSDQIHSIEIGNEPDWYSSTYQGTESTLGPPRWQSTFTNETYVGNCTFRTKLLCTSKALRN